MDWLSNRFYSEDRISHEEYIRMYIRAMEIVDITTPKYISKRNFIIHVLHLLE